MSELKTLSNALDLMRLLEGRPASRISDLADELEISTSAAHRIASTLLRAGVLAQEPGSRRYILGDGVSLGGRASSALTQILEAAPNHLATLRDQTRETVHLATRDGLHATFPLAMESPFELRVSSRLGESVPLHTAANGKVLLTNFTDEEIRNLLSERLDAMTERTITSMEEFLDEMSRVRQQGYATNISEYEAGVYTLAVPVVGRLGEVLCALSVSAPIARVRTSPSRRNDVLEDRMLAATRKCAQMLTASLTP